MIRWLKSMWNVKGYVKYYLKCYVKGYMKLLYEWWHKS